MMRNINKIPTPSNEGKKKFLAAKAAVTGKSLRVKDSYIKKAVATKVAKGLTEIEAKELVISRVENKVLLPNDSILMNNGVELKISELLTNPSKYNGEYCYDPLELEKGQSKAVINSSNALNISLWSFIHGGTKYEVMPDFDYIIDVAEDSYDNGSKKNRSLMANMYAMCERAELSGEQRKVIAGILKKKRIASSIFELARQKTLISSDTYPEFIHWRNKTPLNTIENFKILLHFYKYKYAYDVILKEAIISNDIPRTDTDNKLNSQIADIQSLCAKHHLSTTAVKMYLWSLMDVNSFNPLITMVNSKKWDGINRLSTLIRTISTKDNPIYVQAVLTKWLTQCIAAWDLAKNTPLANALPRFENILTFVGPQGINKTKFFELLFPDEFRKYAVTGMHLDVKNKDYIKLAISSGITELGEVDSTLRNDPSLLKAFLSLSVDKFRRPYAQVESEFPRRTSFCATVNLVEFLVDLTGNRRFHPILVNDIDFTTYLTIDKQQLWAQINETQYLAGKHWWIDKANDPEVHELLLEKHREHAVVESADEIAMAVIAYTQSTDPKILTWKNATEIATHFKLRAENKKNISIIKRRLREAGINEKSYGHKFQVALP